MAKLFENLFKKKEVVKEEKVEVKEEVKPVAKHSTTEEKIQDAARRKAALQAKANKK